MMLGAGTPPVLVVEDGRLSGREKGHFCSFVLSCVSVVTGNPFTSLVGGVDLGEQGLRTRRTRFSYDSQLFSECQTTYALRVKSHLSKADKPHVVKTCVSMEAHKYQQLK